MAYIGIMIPKIQEKLIIELSYRNYYLAQHLHNQTHKIYKKAMFKRKRK